MTKPAATTGKIVSGEDKAAVAARIASELKATDVVILDVREVSSITDYFVVLTGNSLQHLRSVSGRIEEELRKIGARPTSVDGARSTGWVAMDYGNVIIHAMSSDSRQLYDLERLWGDAPRVEFASS